MDLLGDTVFFSSIFPVFLYWVYGYICYKPQDDSKNKVTFRNVIIGVLFNQFVQILISLFLGYLFSQHETHHFVEHWMLRLSRFIFAIILLDTYQYWVHRLFHTFPSLYYYHSFHHKVYLSYSFSALYVHPLESFVLDTGSMAFATLISGLVNDHFIFLIFISLSTIKTIDDHCGRNTKWYYSFSLFENDSNYHSIHHTLKGIKYNFSQPYFVFWDKICKTYLNPKEFKFE